MICTLSSSLSGLGSLGDFLDSLIILAHIIEHAGSGTNCPFIYFAAPKGEWEEIQFFFFINSLDITS